jgi:cytochrome c
LLGARAPFQRASTATWLALGLFGRFQNAMRPNPPHPERSSKGEVARGGLRGGHLHGSTKAHHEVGRRTSLVRLGAFFLMMCLSVFEISAQTAVPVPASPQPPTASPSPKGNVAERRARPGNLVGHGGPVKAIAVDWPSGILTGAFDYAMGHWTLEVENGPMILRRFDRHGGAVNAVAFAMPDTIHIGTAKGDGHYSLTGSGWGLAAGDDAAVRVWDLRGRDEVHQFTGHSGKIVALAVTRDGLMTASASWDRTARLWDLAKLKPGPVLDGHQGPVNGVAFSNDGRRVFTASADGQVRAFDVATGALDRAIIKHGWGINVLARLPGGDRLVFGALNGSVAIVDGVSGAIVRELPSHDRPVLAVAVHETGELIATGGGDGLIRVMRAGDGSVVEEYKNPYGPVWALAFTPAGDGVYYGGLDDFVTLWKISPRESFEVIDSSYPRRFQVRGGGDDLIAQGEMQFARKCSICHTLEADGKNRAGPTLHNVFGRKIATLPGYPFSEPLKTLDIVWSAETVAKLFELGPDVFTPGSKMPLQKMTDKAQRDALIAFLRVATVAPAPASSVIDETQKPGQSPRQ